MGVSVSSPGHRARRRAADLGAGFTYVELLIALGIFSFAALALVAPLVLGSRNGAGSRELMLAAQAAALRADALHALPYTAMASGNDVVGAPPARFRRTWTVQTDIPHPGLATLSVKVEPLRRDVLRPSAAVTIWSLRAR